MRVDLAMACVDRQPCKIGFINQNFKRLLPDAIIAPTNETTMGIPPTAEVRREIPPRSAGAYEPKHRIDKTPVVLGDDSPAPLTTGQMRLKFLPDFIRNIMPAVRWYCYIHLLIGEI
jgi:hypothetical protein